jgi:hypothetical protein
MAVFLFRRQHLIRQLSDSDVASANPLQVIEIKRGRLVNRFAVLRELAPRFDNR